METRWSRPSGGVRRRKRALADVSLLGTKLTWDDLLDVSDSFLVVETLQDSALEGVGNGVPLQFLP